MSKETGPAGDVFDPIERASRDELQALQRDRMAWSLRHADENVPHYQESFDRVGVHPSDFKNLPDLSKFPFTTKADFRTTYPFGLLAVPQDKIARLHGSSGTTGKPNVVA